MRIGSMLTPKLVAGEAGTSFDVTMHDGSHLRLTKLPEHYDPTDRAGAVKTLLEAHEKGEILTGVFYIDTQKPAFTDLLNLVDDPLATLPQDRVRPSKQVLDDVMNLLTEPE